MSGVAPAATLLTAARYFALMEKGVLRADDRVELLDGVIVSVSPQNPPHATAVSRVAQVLTSTIGRRALLRVQSPLVASRRSVPEPDIALVEGDADEYEEAHPTSALLVVEIADSSLVRDRVAKAAIYAGAGVTEYWIVNLRTRRVEIFRDPRPRARRYDTRSILGPGGRVRLAAFPSIEIAVEALLPRR